MSGEVDAAERAANTARAIVLGNLDPDDFPSVFAEQIRQAEQAARLDEREKVYAKFREQTALWVTLAIYFLPFPLLRFAERLPDYMTTPIILLGLAWGVGYIFAMFRIRAIIVWMLERTALKAREA